MQVESKQSVTSAQFLHDGHVLASAGMPIIMSQCCFVLSGSSGPFPMMALLARAIVIKADSCPGFAGRGSACHNAITASCNMPTCFHGHDVFDIKMILIA